MSRDYSVGVHRRAHWRDDRCLNRRPRKDEAQETRRQQHVNVAKSHRSIPHLSQASSEMLTRGFGAGVNDGGGFGDGSPV